MIYNKTFKTIGSFFVEEKIQNNINIYPTKKQGKILYKCSLKLFELFKKRFLKIGKEWG